MFEYSLEILKITILLLLAVSNWRIRIGGLTFGTDTSDENDQRMFRLLLPKCLDLSKGGNKRT